ncbi:MAG: flagellin [Candidatus Cloacimonetes bacterium]|nr:flagellin [Candidatus Cloacimonadota bacterium]MDY0230725.1 flagellin [Candidatus Cloacimonadaceae bacterium]
MRINHNIAALNTYNKLTANNAATSKSLEKLSSGLKINRAGDNAAGLAISEKMRGQIRGLDQASTNASDSISLIQTAEGALNETHSILQRMRELAVQSSNDTNTTTDRDEIQKEINQLTDEVDRIANTTEFNTQKLLDGSKKGLVEQSDSSAVLQNNSGTTFTLDTVAADIGASFTVTITATNESTAFVSANFDVSVVGGTAASLAIADNNIDYNGGEIDFSAGTLKDLKAGESITISVKKEVLANTNVKDALTMQIGANSGQSILVGINSMKSDDLGLRASNGDALDLSSAKLATGAITQINNALESVSAERSKLGSIQNRLEHTINNLGTSSENLSAAEGRIRDVDMAKEMMEFTKNNILSQAAQSMLAQANQQPQGVLQLLQ